MPAPHDPRTNPIDNFLRRWRRINREGWIKYLALGLVLAPIFTLTPYLQYVGWLFKSLIHETGHTLYAWYVGCPALPAINPAGHAASFHAPQYLFLVLVIFGALIWQAAEHFREPFMRVVMLAAVITYPLVALHPGTKQLFHLLSGHLGELAVGGIFLWQARSGWFTHGDTERYLYAACGWYLVFVNFWLCFSLPFVPGALAAYRDSGSFGLTNDYLRVAEDQLNAPIATVAIPMLLVTLAVPVIALWLGGKFKP